MALNNSVLTALKTGGAVAALVIAMPALSQTPGAPPELPAEEIPEAQEPVAGSDDIIVTARRRTETLLEVPIAISVFSGENLEDMGAIDITDIAQQVPNVTLEASRGTNTTLTAFIRGVGQQDPVAGFEQGVGIYIDDVYLNRPQSALIDIYDVERIEVLRGPQGTLYGRNTIGGAVKYVTRRIPNEPELRVRTTLGTDELVDVVTTASTPVGDGTLRFGGTLGRFSRGGFGENLTTGEENYNKDIWAGRLTAEVVSDQIFVRLSGDYTQDDSNPRGGHRLIPGLQSGAPVLENVFDTRGGLTFPEQEVEAWGVSLFAEAYLSPVVTLRSISAYRDDRTGSPIDFDALPAVDLDVPVIYENDQFSQELQLLYDNGPLSGLFGAYYLNANASNAFDVLLFTLVPGLNAFTSGNVETDTWALFSDFTYDFSPQWSVSLGGRFTHDERTADINRRLLIGVSETFGGDPFLIRQQTDFRGTETFEEFTPRASVSFKPNLNQHIWASYSKGFKGGGFDPRGVGIAAPDLDGDGDIDREDVFEFLSFEPETVDSYELGWRGSTWGDGLNYSLVGFYADYTNVQIPGSVGTVINGVQQFIGITTNAGAAEFKGVEFEGNAILARDFGVIDDHLNFSWSLGYIDAEYTQFIDQFGQEVSDLREVQNTPEWTASGTLRYELPLWAGQLAAATTVSYRSKTFQFEVPNPALDQPGFALWDASLIWRSDNERYFVGLHGRNLTDEEYITSGYSFVRQNTDGSFVRDPAGNVIPTLGREGVLTAFYGNPRQVFVSFGVNF